MTCRAKELVGEAGRAGQTADKVGEQSLSTISRNWKMIMDKLFIYSHKHVEKAFRDGTARRDQMSHVLNFLHPSIGRDNLD